MANRKFDAWFSSDEGTTWSKMRASGWAISDIQGKELEDDYGFNIALTHDGTMIDIGISEAQFKLLLKDIAKLKQSDVSLKRRVHS